MADQDVAVEAEVNAGEGAKKEKTDDTPEYAPGVLCAIEAPPEKEIEFDDQEISAIKSLNRKVAMRDMPSRREQLVRVWEARLFDRGFQHLLPRQNGGWEIPSVGSGYGPGEDEDRSAWEIDIYSSYRKIICAALTREVPGVLFEPTDQDDDRDITAASSADKLKAKISRDNKLKELQGEGARFLWTDGLSVHFSRYVLDAQGYGYEPPPKGDVPEDEETGEAATEIKSAEPNDGQGTGSGTEDVEGNDSANAAASGDVDSTGAESESDTEEQTENVESGPETPGTPRGHELITVAGALNWKLPIKANCLKECGYARYSWEQATSLAKAQYPKKAEQITPSRSGSDGGSGGDDLERLARINVMLGVEDNFITEDSAVYDVTMQKYFYRPEALFDIDDKAVRDSIIRKCPKGLYVTFAGEVFCEGRNASMDDHLAITFADAGDGVHRPGLGTPLIAPQKILNTCAELAYEYFVHGVPMTYMDDEMFDTEAIGDQENLVGGIRPFEANGSQINGYFWFREDPVPFPEQLVGFTQWLMEGVAQLMSGAYPALFGGDTGANDTGTGIKIARDQALGRLGLPWRNIKETTSCVMRQNVQLLAENREGLIKLGGDDKSVVNVADLKGNFLCYPDTDENIPETWTEKSNRFAMIITDAATNPFFQTLLDSVSNLKLVQQMSGFKELHIPQLVSYEEQLGEIAILFKGGPVPNPEVVELEQAMAQMSQHIQEFSEAAPAPPAQVDPMTGQPMPPQVNPQLAQMTAQLKQMAAQAQELPPLVSSYPISDTDDDDVHALTCLEILRSPKGRAMKNGTADDQKHYANLKLHWQEHEASKAKKAAANQPKALPPKPPSLSANVKDLPPKEAAMVLTLAGVPSSAADFAQQDQDEAIAKHPVTLGEPVGAGSKNGR